MTPKERLQKARRMFRAVRRGGDHEDRLMLILGLYHAGLNDGQIAQVIGCNPGRERQDLDLPALGLNHSRRCDTCGEPTGGTPRQRKCYWCSSKGRRGERYVIARVVLPELARAYPATYVAARAQAIQQWPWIESSIVRWEQEGRMRNRAVGAHALRAPGEAATVMGGA
jgi:hypothetical protein